MVFIFFASPASWPRARGEEMAGSDSLIISSNSAHYPLDNPLYIHLLNE